MSTDSNITTGVSRLLFVQVFVHKELGLLPNDSVLGRDSLLCLWECYGELELTRSFPGFQELHSGDNNMFIDAELYTCHISSVVDVIGLLSLNTIQNTISKSGYQISESGYAWLSHFTHFGNLLLSNIMCSSFLIHTHKGILPLIYCTVESRQGRGHNITQQRYPCCCWLVYNKVACS